MPNKHAEELCAMMDGELGQSEARFLLRRLGHEQQLIARWKRYHFSRAVLRGEISVSQVCLCDRIAEVIAKEPTPTLEQANVSAFMPAWLRPVAGFAVAASVAIAAFTLMQTEPLAPVADQIASRTSVTVPELSRPIGLRAQLASASNSRLQAYVMRHNAVTLPRRGRDLVPYMYLVAPPVSKVEQELDPQSESINSAQPTPVGGVNE